MQSFILRKAEAKDELSIRDLIRRVHINPFNLDWQRFVIVENESGQFLGCGQIKPHSDGSLELASIAVQPGWQNRGVGKMIINDLLSNSPRPLYLTCRAALESYYAKFGFRPVLPGEVPPSFRLVWILFKILNWFSHPRFQGRILIKTEL